MSNTDKAIKLLIILVIATTLISCYKNNIWHLQFKTIDKMYDDKGVMHYKLLDKKYDFWFDYYTGKYKEPLVLDFLNITLPAVTVNVNKTNYEGKLLYAKKDELVKLLEAYEYNYEIIEVEDEIKEVLIHKEYLSKTDNSFMKEIESLFKSCKFTGLDIENTFTISYENKDKTYHHFNIKL